MDKLLIIFKFMFKNKAMLDKITKHPTDEPNPLPSFVKRVPPQRRVFLIIDVAWGDENTRQATPATFFTKEGFGLKSSR